MKAPAKAWWAAVLAFLPFPIAAALLTWLRDLPGALPWVLWAVLLVLGLVTGVLVFLYVKRRAPTKTAPAGLAKRVDEVFSDAGRRLKRSKRPRIRSTRALVLVGPSGSTKTTLIERSDLGVELLVGEVNRGDEIIPTSVANVWFGGDCAIVEAGPEVVDDEGSWKRLVKRLRPRRWAPTLGRGALAPRAAIVCVPIDEFLTPDAVEYARHTAAALRERLAQLAAGLGIELPVYVVFTKVDRIPYFADFVAVLDDAEAQQVLGATLPFQVGAATEAYGERQTQRVQGALERLHRSLARSRMDLLPREGDRVARLGAYEFPRELNKVRDRLTQFLVDLCRPTQLSVGPQLRGFYFTGVRAV
ncbi:MAG: type VI secretion system protein, partial [Gemmatimonadota bacterium]|nr:type VI secretion system protein [Gemmatimonadota bacterium]